MEPIRFVITKTDNGCKAKTDDKRATMSDRNLSYNGSIQDCIKMLSDKYNARGYEVLFDIFGD